jgi:hypothetical protein
LVARQSTFAISVSLSASSISAGETAVTLFNGANSNVVVSIMSVAVNFGAADQGAFSAELQIRSISTTGTGGTAQTPIAFNSSGTPLPSQVTSMLTPSGQPSKSGLPYGKATISTGFYTATDVYVSTSSSDPTWLFRMIPDVEMSPIVLNSTASTGQGISVDLVGNTGEAPFPTMDITIIFTIS